MDSFFDRIKRKNSAKKGKQMRIQTILSSSWSERYIQVPAVFFDFGWNLYLPQGMNSVVLSVITYIFQGYSKEDIFLHMEEETERLELQPFPLAQGSDNFYNPDEWHYLFLREQKCKTILVRSDLTYPTSIQDMIQLLIDLGILIEVNNREITYLDFILHPFPRPEESLNLTEEEIIK
jgi:hypothetical protein